MSRRTSDLFCRRPLRQGGMAVIAVLWIVAALSVMVIGMTATVRQQIQTTGLQRDQASGQAIGEAAVALVLQSMLATQARLAGTATVAVEYAGQPIEVEIAPLDGLISLNGAAPPLLAALLRVAGGLDAGRAEALAQAMVEWRDGRPALDATAPGAGALTPRRFEAPEDLMLVPGIDYPLYSRLAPLVTADLPDVGQVNPQAAPVEVLTVLAQGDAARAAGFARQRAGGQPGADTSGLQPTFLGGGGTDLYRLRARVPLEEGKILLLTRDVALGAIYARAAPWRVLGTARQIVAPPS